MDATKVQVAAVTEGTPGEAESVTAADVLVRPLDSTTFDAEFEQIDSPRLKSNQSPRPVSISQRLGSIGLAYELAGAGNLTDVPDFSPLLLSAMLSRSAVSLLGLNTVTGGPFLASETITQAVSGATGFVCRQYDNPSTGQISIVVTSGTFNNSDIVTGSVSGATAAATALVIAGGHLFRPDDTDILTTGHSTTFQFLNDGAAWLLNGGLSSLSMAFRACQPCEVTQEIQGPIADPTSDALYTGVTFPEEEGVGAIPKLSNDAGVVIGTYSPTDLEEVTWNFPITLTPRVDINGTWPGCVRLMGFARDVPTIAIQPALVPPSVFDFFGSLTAETLYYFEATLGSVAGKRHTVIVPKAQIVEAGWTSKDPNLSTTPLVLRCTEGEEGNDESMLLCH